MSETETVIINEILSVEAQDNKPTKQKTHSSIALKIETKEQLETYRKYPRETYDEILDRLFTQIESRRGKKKEELV